MLSRRNILTAGAATIAAAATAKADEIQSLAPSVTDSSLGARVTAADVSISVADSPLSKALDFYYDWLIKLAQQNGYTDRNKLLLNNTITSFDISQDTPFFNEGLFRSFADRVFKGSPENMGPTYRADRLSQHYKGIIQVAASAIDQQYDNIVPKVERLQVKLKDQTDKLNDRVNAIIKQWNDLAKNMGLKVGDVDYELKFLAYLEQIRYADQIAQYSENIDMINGSIDAVRRLAYTPQQQLILDNLAELSDTKMIARPNRPNFERTTPGVSELMFANPMYRVGAIWEMSPYTLPLGDLVKFLKEKGTREIKIEKNSESQEKHDKQWAAGGGGRFSIFGIGIGGSAGGAGSSSWSQEIKKSGGIEISYENIAEVLVDRGLWFNPGIFQDPALKKTLSKIPGYDRLQYVSVSLIIARGTTLKLKFDSAINTDQWTKQSFQASGGVSIFGYRFGGSGARNTYDYSLEIAGDKKSVTFKDDPQLARLLAVRLEPFVDLGGGGGVASVSNSAAEKFKKGQISYLDYQKSRF